ncbi:MAG: leucine-rich repeat domain-containing protein [Clostridia bacterium]|nr:leucine-rich repeat domain-containing protein [Clostridia bacterium]
MCIFCFCCSNLTEIIIPDSVTSIEGLFSTTGIKDIVLQKGATRIEDYAFSGCNNLTKVVIPEGITSIGKRV